MTKKDAIDQAVSLLKDEANSLACLAHEKVWEALPHRARVAVQREIQRFREIASALKPTKVEEEEV